MTRREEAIQEASTSLAKSYLRLIQGKASVSQAAKDAIAAYEAHMRPEIIHLSELLDLPMGTIIRDIDGVAWLKDADEEGSTWWTVTGSEDDFNARGILRPARVIHWGDSDA